MSSSKPKPPQSKEAPKQKSLMSFFSKGPQTQAPTTPALKRRLQDASSDAPSSSPLDQTPRLRKTSTSSVMGATFTGSSDGKSNRTGSPPPSSDVIDIDMLSDEEEEQPKKVRPYYICSMILHTIVICITADQTKGPRAGV